MERRTFLALIPASLLTAPLAAEAQMGKGWRIGYLVPGPAACPVTKSIRAFRQGLLDAGLVEGRDITIDRRCYPTDAVARKILDELLHARPSVLVAGGLAALAMKDVRGIPIVFGSVPDPVGDGLVHSLARPGTNMTGLTDLSPELDAKRMEILKGSLAERSPCRNTRCVGSAPDGPISCRNGSRGREGEPSASSLHRQKGRRTSRGVRSDEKRGCPGYRHPTKSAVMDGANTHRQSRPYV
jgi:hypothetical protein